MKLPITSCQSHRCSLLNCPNSFCRGMFKLNANLMQIHCSTRSVILNVMATQYTCSLNGVPCPHWLVQWSCHCSHMGIIVHSLWLPGYINVMQIVLFVLTMAGPFPDRLPVCYELYLQELKRIPHYKMERVKCKDQGAKCRNQGTECKNQNGDRELCAKSTMHR